MSADLLAHPAKLTAVIIETQPRTACPSDAQIAPSSDNGTDRARDLRQWDARFTGLFGFLGDCGFQVTTFSGRTQILLLNLIPRSEVGRRLAGGWNRRLSLGPLSGIAIGGLVHRASKAESNSGSP